MAQINYKVRGKVGSFEIKWMDFPRGTEGETQVSVAGVGELTLRWRRDRSGLWIEFPESVQGFDFEKKLDDSGREFFKVAARGSDEAWDALRFERAGEIASNGSAKGKSGARVRAQMPGKIVKISVQPGDKVVKDQTLLVMEAMKMENEIRSPADGTIKEIKISVGQAVESGADLILIS